MSNQPVKPKYLSFAELKAHLIGESLKPHCKDVWCLGWHVDDWLDCLVYQPTGDLEDAIRCDKRLPRPFWVIAHRGYIVAESPVTLELTDSWVKEVVQKYQEENDELKQQVERQLEWVLSLENKGAGNDR